MRLAWKTSAKRLNKICETFEAPEGFYSWQKTHPIARDTPIYVDSNLKNGTRGEDVVRGLHEAGYTHLYLATGYPPEHFRENPELLGILAGIRGKEPPAW
jgi:hypothetical protein